tara:strand:- start:32282 stop:32959 length:678 start_codon:yes stop_codon:yes gene_type:complete
MKNLIKIVLFYCLVCTNSYSQQITIKRIESRLITNQGIEFVGNLNTNNKDLYTFSNWNNKGVIFLDNKRYRLGNINFNVTTNSFVSRINRNKLFSFKTSEIDSVLINNLLFKKIGNTFYEVLFENENNLFLKKHDITFQKGVENRLGVGTLGKTKTIIAYNYLIKFGSVFKRIELNKSSIIGLLEDDTEKNAVEVFVENENLSYRKVNDIIKIFKFILENSSVVS